MAVLVPWAYQGGTESRSNLKIGERVMDTYFELKQQRENQSQSSSVNKQNKLNESESNQESEVEGINE